MTGAESAELECQRQSTEPSGRTCRDTVPYSWPPDAAGFSSASQLMHYRLQAAAAHLATDPMM